MTILTDSEVMARFKVSKHFIAEHAPRWGAFSRPRKHIAEEVEKYLAGLSAAKRSKYLNVEIRKQANRQMVEDVVNSVFARRQMKKAANNG